MGIAPYGGLTRVLPQQPPMARRGAYAWAGRGMAVLLLWLSVGFAQTPPLAGSALPAVSSACEVDYPPFCIVHEDGRADGFSVELLRAALAAMHREVTFRTGPWAEVKEWLARGEVQALPLVGRTPERETIFDFTVPYLTMHGAIVVRDETQDVHSLSDLRGRRVATMAGDNAEEFLRRTPRDFTIVTTSTFPEAFRLVAAGACDAVVVQRLVAVRLVATTGIGNLRVVNQPIAEFSQDWCFAVREGDKDTLAILNEGLALTMADGTHRRLYAKWFAALELPQRRLVVGGDRNYPPFEFLDPDGRPTGYNVDLTRAIAAQVGLDIEIRLGPWAEMVRDLERGEIDALAGMFYSPRRDLTLDFSPSHTVVHCVSVVRKGSGPAPTTLAELAGKRLVVQDGDIMRDYAVEHGLGALTTAVPTQEQALRELAAGRHDCALVARNTALFLIPGQRWSNLVVGRKPLLSAEYCYAVPNGSKALLAELCDGMEMLAESGEYRRIHDKWLGRYDEGSPRLTTILRYVAVVVTPLVLVLLVVLLWTWSLRRQVTRRTRDLAVLARRQQAILAAVPDIIMEVDCNRVYTWANPAGIEFFGADVCGQQADHYFVGDQDVIARVQALFAGNDESIYLESRQRRQDGETRLLAWWCRVLKDESGKVCGALSTARDITEQKRAEEALRESEDKFKYIFEAANVGKSLTLPNGSVNVNRAFAEMLGYTREELQGKTWQELTPADEVETVQRLLEPLLKGVRDTARCQKRYLHKNGSTVWVDLSVAIRRDASGRPQHFITTIVDITEQRRAEEARDEHARQQAVIAALGQLALTATDIAALLDEAARQVAAVLSVELCTVLELLPDRSAFVLRAGVGWREGLVGQATVEVGPDSQAGFTLQSKAPVVVADLRTETRFRGPALLSEHHVVSGLSTPIGDPGRPYGVLGAHTTQRRDFGEHDVLFLQGVANLLASAILHHAQEATLRASEETHRALVAGLPDIVVRLDCAGRHLFVSENIREVTGLSAEQFIGKTHRQLGFPEEDCRFWEEAIRRVVESGETAETELTLEEKRQVHNWRLVPEYDAQGKVGTVLSISRDITAHRRAEQNYRMLFREMLNGFALHEIICDAAGRPIDYRFLTVNPAFERLTGLRAEAIVGRTVLDVLPGIERRWIETYGKVALTGVPTSFEDRSADLQKCFEVFAFRPAPNQFACVFADTTARKQAEEERQKLQAQLVQAQKMESIGRLAGGVAHDFNNLLMGIMNYVELCRSALPSDHPIRNWLDEITSDAQRSAEITRQLLAFARIQTVSPKVLDLNDALAGMLRMLRRLIGEDVDLAWMPGAEIGPVKIDPSQVDQILANLCVNARDAIDGAGKITIETANVTLGSDYCATHPEAVPGEYVMLAVSDNGCGMDKDVLAHVFEPFFTTKAAGMGTGLGLATVYGIVKQNRGHVTVYSEPGQGTTFRIHLPKVAAPAATPAAAAPAQVPRGRGETVLLVEDEKSLRVTCGLFLEGLGYAVLAAESPAVALTLAAQHEGDIALLLTDVVMPGMDGRRLAAQLETLKPGIRALFMSGYTANVIAHHGVLDEGVRFLGKPFSRDELARKVREVLDGEQA